MDMEPMKRIHAWIFARGGSKGVPHKNLRTVSGVSLIGRAVLAAKGVPLIKRVFVSTDSLSIAEEARRYGAEIPFMRPDELAQDISPERLSWAHAVQWERENLGQDAMDVMVVVPVTAPLRQSEDIVACLSKYQEGGYDTVIGVTRSDRHPAFNMVTMDGQTGRVTLVMPCGQGYYRRQDAPAVYNITTAAYVTSPAFVLNEPGSYMKGRVGACELPERCSIDVDSEADFAVAEAYASRVGGFPSSELTFASLSSMRGRTVLLTGGNGYLGRTMAQALAEKGADLAIVDLRLAPERFWSDIAARHGVRIQEYIVDMADEQALRALPETVEKTFGRLDVVVNNAAFVGTSSLKGWAVPFAQQRSDTWRAALEVNLTAVFNLVQAAVPALERSGHGAVVNIASIYGVVGPNCDLYEGTNMGNPAAYAASKGGVVQLTRWLSTVLAPRIRVNAITPGGIFRGQPKAFLDKYEGRTPLGRMAREDDFIGAIVYFASDLSRYVTGQNLLVDGGFSVW